MGPGVSMVGREDYQGDCRRQLPGVEADSQNHGDAVDADAAMPVGADADDAGGDAVSRVFHYCRTVKSFYCCGLGMD